MERGGELTVETTTGPSESEGGERLIVRIADSGCGILPENLGQIFDPFFTTKSREKGTGLGLCVSYSIVHLYGGTIDVASQPERGTTVTVTLPLERRLPEAAPTKLEGQRV
jgi:signal transduction histidine kinase